MSVVVGSGDYTFRVVEDWAKLPPGYVFGDVAAVGIDSRDRVYCFNRGEHPMIVLDREGNYITSWGHDTFDRPHGIHVGPDDTLYCTDDGDHTVRHCTLDGKVLLELGVPGEPAPYVSGEPFNRCTHTALSPTQDLYVSDGYGNARIHKYDPKGRLLLSWGEPGCDPGQFNIPHNIHCDADGWVFVADRENHRVQVFDGKGRYETQWNNLHRPSGLFMTSGTCPICYIGEIGPYQAGQAIRSLDRRALQTLTAPTGGQDQQTQPPRPCEPGWSRCVLVPFSSLLPSLRVASARGFGSRTGPRHRKPPVPPPRASVGPRVRAPFPSR